MAVMDTTCLYSTVKNISGVDMTFGFLPPHGRTLAGAEEFTVFGDIRQQISGNRGGEAGSAKTAQDAFENAIASGYLEILQTPSIILRDTATNAPKMLKLTSGTLSQVDPCWANSV